jgi:hypothetical protein
MRTAQVRDWLTVLSAADRLVLATTVLAVLHHIDHVLRVIHSGWPFHPTVSPFTYSLLVYPVIASVLIARGWPRLRIWLSALIFLVPTLSHVFLETPLEQYRNWTAEPAINPLGAGRFFISSCSSFHCSWSRSFRFKRLLPPSF